VPWLDRYQRMTTRLAEKIARRVIKGARWLVLRNRAQLETRQERVRLRDLLRALPGGDPGGMDVKARGQLRERTFAAHRGQGDLDDVHGTERGQGAVHPGAIAPPLRCS
jgi:hypothetical protein